MRHNCIVQSGKNKCRLDGAKRINFPPDLKGKEAIQQYPNIDFMYVIGIFFFFQKSLTRKVKSIGVFCMNRVISSDFLQSCNINMSRFDEIALYY